MQQIDLLVIGGGPAGVTAALRGRELGASVALIERDRMGGTCTNDGCVPTRVLAKAARLMRDTEQYDAYGLTGSRPQLDFARLIERTQRIIYGIQEKKQLLATLQQAGVTVFSESGAARFEDAHTVVTEDGARVRAQKIVICAGGHARRLDFPGSQYALTHSDVWLLKSQPERVVIVGAAATGCQLASVFADFGSEVTLLEAADRILPGEDHDVSDEMRRHFEARGIKIVTGIGRNARIDRQDKHYVYHYQQAAELQPIACDAVILAVGWVGNVESLGLENAGIEHDGNYIKTDDYLCTSVDHIYAAGDINGRQMLVQSAQYEARLAVQNAVLGNRQPIVHQIVPHGGFTDPEYGSVGLTEAQAKERQFVTVATMPYAALDRAVIDGYPEGFCKLIVGRDRRLLGAHVVGEQALEVVQIIAAGMAAGMQIEQLAELEIAYPTYAAIIGLVARQIAARLGQQPLLPQWRALDQASIAEWERQGRLQ